MLLLWTQLVGLLIVILIAALLFANALEFLGQKMGISTGVAGSLFAAVFTALPETTIPVLAIIAGTTSKTVNEEISVGAILGAPLMLSTLSICVIALSIIKKRGLYGRLAPEKTGLVRDLDFFLAAFFIAAIAMYTPLQPIYLRAGLGVCLIALYIIYIVLTVRSSKSLVQKGHGVAPTEKLLFTRVGLKNNTTTILIQLLVGMILLLFGAKGFINDIQNISQALGVSTLLLSLLIIPIATELPEKINSVLWARKNQDTLAVGNITGAMVFQGTLLPALGIMLTPWQPSPVVLTGILITFIAAAWLRVNASTKGFSIMILLLNGGLYLLYLFFTLHLYRT